MQACHVVALLGRAPAFLDDLVERHRCGIDDASTGWAVIEQRLGHQRAGVEANRTPRDQLAAPHGDKIGRTIGYPTANLKSTDEEKIVLGDGIYAVYVSYDSKTYKGMMSIGFRPTVNGRKRVTEVNLFDFNKEIYGSILRVTVIKYLRNEVKFDGLEQLKLQLNLDKEQSITIL